ncbi:MAG TPA: HEAT repeat domain-containing protein [Candidatus Ozemobacteraceae bacterium]|nr:HEAT repeat domain-containing protein [Candidatus Ozemobacteraceae bacterium]
MVEKRMSDKPAVETAEKRDVSALRRRVAALRTRKGADLDTAICDIIDLKGVSLAVLLEGLPRLPIRVQLAVARRVEDFFFFHPDRGRRLVGRLEKAIQKAAASCWPNLIAGLADVVARSGHVCPLTTDLRGALMAVVRSDTDLMRKGKAVEMLAHVGHRTAVPDILGLMVSTQESVDDYAHFSFLETSLFALKALGGEAILRLLINPLSLPALTQFRVEWRERDAEATQEVLKALQKLDDGFAQLLLKVVDLAEFNLPFTAMVMEGLEHRDKWVRQIATESFAKMKKHADIEHLMRMCQDPAPEVRLMAVQALGSFKGDLANERLMDVACNEQESYEMRMNALYALFGQKNASALESLRESPNPSIALNARGLRALLMPRDQGLKDLLDVLPAGAPSRMHELFHYLMELSRPEDLTLLLEASETLKTEAQREAWIPFLQMFLKNKAGPSLETVLAGLDERQRRVLEVLRKGFVI